MSEQATSKAVTFAVRRTARRPSSRSSRARSGRTSIDVRKLYGQTGMFTYDPGFTSTASCSSKITFIDGDEGILLHRGYTIEDLAKNSSFLEVAYLILNGELPNRGAVRQVRARRDLPHHGARADPVSCFAASGATRIRWR